MASSPTILVAEDDVAVREMIVRGLSPKYRVIQASDGLHASELLMADAHAVAPHLRRDDAEG